MRIALKASNGAFRLSRTFARPPAAETVGSEDRALTAGDLEVSARALGVGRSGDMNELASVLAVLVLRICADNGL
jgi:hypothetical protein